MTKRKPQQMSGALAEKCIDQLPDELTEEQLSAFMLTLLDCFAGDNPPKAVSLMVTCAILYARTVGITDSKTALLFRGVAETLDKDIPQRKVH